MKDKLEKYYDTFTVKERVNLTIAALARGDREEFLRLRNSCAMKNHVSTDENYTNCMEDLNRIGISYNLYREQFTKEALSNMAIRDIYKSKIKGYEQGFFDGLMAADNVPENHHVWCKIKEYTANYHKKILKAEEQMKDAISKLEAIKTALKLFCEEIGIDFDNMLAFISFDSKDDILSVCNPSVEADKDLAESLKSDFLALWGRKNF